MLPVCNLLSACVGEVCLMDKALLDPDTHTPTQIHVNKAAMIGQILPLLLLMQPPVFRLMWTTEP